MDKKTANNVHSAFTEEAKAHIRLNVFAEKANEEGFPQISHLFRAVAKSESVHARRLYTLLDASVGDTDENLQRAFHAETGVAGVEYLRMLREAHEESEEKAALVFSQARDVEKLHADIYKRALDHVIWERITEYNFCSVCGYIAEGGAPELCPVCSAPKTKFNRVD
jgi:rubrerythrin